MIMRTMRAFGRGGSALFAAVTATAFRRIAIGVAVAMNAAFLLIYGAITDWCYCSICGVGGPPPPPLYVHRFLELTVLPVSFVRNIGLPPLVLVNVANWYLVVLALLNAMLLVVRLRVRARPGAVAPRIGFAPLDEVRARHMSLLACILLAAGLTTGAMQRRAWLAEAERVMNTALATASAGRDQPWDVEFAMYDHGPELMPRPSASYVMQIDLGEAGDHFLDRFVVPQAYGGIIRFSSGKRYEISVYEERASSIREQAGWTVFVHPPRRKR